MRAKGIDISHWQESFQNMGNIDFIVLKATEGVSWVDPEFDLFLAEAGTVPIRGAYHYFRTQWDGGMQADHFYNTVKDKGFHFLAVDYEKKNNELDADGEAELMEFWTQLERLVKDDNKPIILYTSPYVFRDNLCHYSTFWLNVPLWMAHYNDLDPQEASPTLFDAPEWKLWQFTDKYNGAYYGVGSENVDQNVYNGTVKQLHEWLLPQGDDPVKKVWTSKTIIFAVLFALVNIAGIFGYAEWVPGDEIAQYVNIGVSIIVALLRVFTKEGVEI